MTLLSGPLKPNWVTAPAFTVMLLLVPLIVLETVSAAVSVWMPAVLKVTPKTPIPLTSVLLLGGVILPSVVVK